jgi:hypothetical protein
MIERPPSRRSRRKPQGFLIRRCWKTAGSPSRRRHMWLQPPLQADHVGLWPIVLQKSFWGGDQNFSGPLMPFARGDMRDHLALHKNDHGASYGRATQYYSGGAGCKSAFARFSASFNFRLLQQNRPLTDISKEPAEVRSQGKADLARPPADVAF